MYTPIFLCVYDCQNGFKSLIFRCEFQRCLHGLEQETFGNNIRSPDGWGSFVHRDILCVLLRSCFCFVHNCEIQLCPFGLSDVPSSRLVWLPNRRLGQAAFLVVPQLGIANLVNRTDISPGCTVDITTTIVWLVVWNIVYFCIYWE